MIRFCFLVTVFFSAFGNQKVVLFNDTSAWYHWGCTATSTSLKESIVKLGFDLQAIPINVTYSLAEVPPFEEFDNDRKFEQFCQKNKEVVQSIREADVVVIIGEGTIHDLRAAPRALLYIAHISKKYFGKHVEIINHSAYPKDDPLLSDSWIENFGVEKEKGEHELKRAQEIYKSVYSELDFVAIREPFSQEEMSNLGISSTLSFDCLPLYIRDHYQTPKQLKPKTLVLAGSVAFSKEGVQQLCRYLERMVEKGFEITVLMGAAAFPAKDDQVFVECLKKHCKVPWALVNASTLNEWLDTINSAHFFISGRFHHSIAAFCLNTPFIALNSNTHKVHGICSLFDHSEPLLFADPQLLDKLLNQTESILSNPPPNNEARKAELCEWAEKNFDGLRSLFLK